MNYEEWCFFNCIVYNAIKIEILLFFGSNRFILVHIPSLEIGSVVEYFDCCKLQILLNLQLLEPILYYSTCFHEQFSSFLHLDFKMILNFILLNLKNIVR